MAIALAALVAALAVAGAFAALGGRGGSSDGGSDGYTVTFDSRGGTYVDPVRGVDHGAYIYAPPAPTKPGSVFGGWFEDPACTDPWVFSAEPVECDVTLYALWGPSSYTIRYDPNKPLYASYEVMGATEDSSHTYGADSPLSRSGFSLTG
ncbi:MAG: InlB B-repeat-containing protein, partial [Candidatus Methanoplasma sp.]|nr:InlB B-repeat-containing protein [Candidatus Methanoplasma sp.]